MLNDEAQAVLADFVKQLQTGEVLSTSFEGADGDLANCDSGGGNEPDKEMRRDGSASGDGAIGNPDGSSTGASQTDAPPAAGSEAQVPYPTPTLPGAPFGVKSNFPATDHPVSGPASPLSVPNPGAQINSEQDSAKNNSAPHPPKPKAAVTREAVPLATAYPEPWRRS